jgi:hypothetical protein
MTYEHLIAGDWIVSPKVYNEFSPGNIGTAGSFAIRGAVEFPAFRLPWIAEGEYRSNSYPHYSGITANQFAAGFDGNPCPHAGIPPALTPAAGDQGCVTVVGAYGQIPVPSFTARERDYGARLGLRVAEPRVYVGVGYLHHEERYGYPKQNGFGFGVEKFPDLDRPVSAYGTLWYYPSMAGNFTYPPGAPGGRFGTNDTFRQRFLTYRLGGTLRLGKTGLFVDAGFLGDLIGGGNLSPSNASHGGAYIGLGAGSRTRTRR